MASVLLVNRRAGNVKVMQRALAEAGHAGVAIGSEADIDTAIHQYSGPHVGVVDISGFGDEVWDVCDRLRSADVPFIVLSTSRELERGCQSLRRGAAGFLQKPVAKSALLRLLATLTDRPEGVAQ